MITARDYEGFRALLNNRRMELHMNFIALNAIAGFPDGYANKLLSSGDGARKNIAPDAMGKLLTALGVEIYIQPVSAGSTVLGGDLKSYPQVKILRLHCRKGGLNRYAKMNSMQRTAFARLGGIASAEARKKKKDNK